MRTKLSARYFHKEHPSALEKIICVPIWVGYLRLMGLLLRFLAY